MELTTSNVTTFACDDLLEEETYERSKIRYIIEPTKAEKPKAKERVKTKPELPKSFIKKIKRTFKDLTGGLNLRME
jgi:hypothetical protein